MIKAKTYDNVRPRIVELLKSKKAAQPRYRVIDVGAAASNWCDEAVDAYLDINRFPTQKTLFIGDICTEATWAQIPEKSFDFAICTHVLEDLRDPMTAIRGLQRIAQAGFIATPTKWNEFSVFEDDLWLGNYHHRWIFDFNDEDGVVIVPKMGAINRFLPQNKLVYTLSPVTLARRVATALGIRKSGKLLGPDVRREGWKSHYPEHELSFIWVDTIPVDFHDWYPTPRAILDHYRALFERDFKPVFECSAL